MKFECVILLNKETVRGGKGDVDFFFQCQGYLIILVSMSFQMIEHAK